MNFFDCFEGIGGFRLGMEIQGHTCIGFYEIDRFVRKSYQTMREIPGEKEGILTSLVVVRCYGEGRIPIDMSRPFATVSQAEIGLNKEDLTCDSI